MDTVRITRRHVILASLMAAVLLLSSVSLLRLSPYNLRNTSAQYFRARIVSVKVQNSQDLGQGNAVRAQLLDGPQKGKLVAVTAVTGFGDAAAKRTPVGSTILLYKSKKAGNQYSFVARWYMPGIATLFIVLLFLVLVIGAWRGITGIFGLAISVFILALFVIPGIVNGHDALTVCIEGAVLITLVSIFIAHGFNKRATVAFAGSMLTLLLVVGCTALASYVTGTSEIIDETSVGLLYAAHPINISGLLTGGVIIASLGALFDITTGQAATVDELHKTDRKLQLSQLFWRGMSVGREHIAALINTLALVYVGVALPSIVTTIVLNQENNYHAPLLVNLNTETIAEEVMRTAVASIGMLLALPITTWLAAYVLPRWTPAVDRKIRQWLKEL